MHRTQTGHRKTTITLVLLGLAMLMGGCASSQEQKPQGQPVPTELFLDIMVQKSPEIACQDEGYRGCLGISQTRCQREIAAVAPGCKTMLMKSMPSHLQGKEQGRQYGREFGMCLVLKHMNSGKYSQATINKCSK